MAWSAACRVRLTLRPGQGFLATARVREIRWPNHRWWAKPPIFSQLSVFKNLSWKECFHSGGSTGWDGWWQNDLRILTSHALIQPGCISCFGIVTSELEMEQGVASVAGRQGGEDSCQPCSFGSISLQDPRFCKAQRWTQTEESSVWSVDLRMCLCVKTVKVPAAFIIPPPA